MRVMQSSLKRANEIEREMAAAGVTLDDLRLVRARTLYERRVKRSFDLLVGAALLVLASPLILLIAMAIRIGLGKGVLYSQKRVGIGGEQFVIWKFRTMRPDRRRDGTPSQIERAGEVLASAKRSLYEILAAGPEPTETTETTETTAPTDDPG